LNRLEIGTLDKGFIHLSASHFFVPKFGVSALHLKCSKHVALMGMLFSEECENRRLVDQRNLVGQAVLNVIMNLMCFVEDRELSD
jgi:hypothetical protein